MEAMRQYGVALALVLVVVGVLYIAFSVAAGAVTFDWSWFGKPLKDADMGDAFVLLVTYMVLRK
jgi:hypothetical protein